MSSHTDVSGSDVSGSDVSGAGVPDGLAPDAPVRLPRGERPETGDEAVETALDGLDAADGGHLDAHIEAAEAVHRALQQRLSDAHG